MNNVYFACRECKDYIDGGYRWPVSTLYKDQWSNFPLTVSVDDVLAHAEYWSGETLHPFLAATLPAARAFLMAHRTHDLVFGDSESFLNMDDPTHSAFDWLELNSLTDASHLRYCFEPRYQEYYRRNRVRNGLSPDAEQDGEPF